LPSQRIILAKLAGTSAEVALRRIGAWSASRSAEDPNPWSPEQWSADMRQEADDFVAQLRANGFALPVIHYVEWCDMWSMGLMFSQWLTPSGLSAPIRVHANRSEIYAYSLPDDGRLKKHLAAAGAQQFQESDWFVGRLREAVDAWDTLVDRAALVVIRQTLGGCATDEEVKASTRTIPEWLRGPETTP
jgi:hypothetical protein